MLNLSGDQYQLPPFRILNDGRGNDPHSTDVVGGRPEPSNETPRAIPEPGITKDFGMHRDIRFLRGRSPNRASRSDGVTTKLDLAAENVGSGARTYDKKHEVRCVPPELHTRAAAFDVANRSIQYETRNVATTRRRRMRLERLVAYQGRSNWQNYQPTHLFANCRLLALHDAARWRSMACILTGTRT